MDAEDFLKQHLNFTDRDLEYRPAIGYWKALELMKEYDKAKLKLLNIPDVSNNEVAVCDKCGSDNLIWWNDEQYQCEKCGNHVGYKQTDC